MKKTLLFIMIFVFIFTITACGVSPAEKTSSSLNDIQNIVRKTQNAFENNKYQETQNGISKLIELSKNSFYCICYMLKVTHSEALKLYIGLIIRTMSAVGSMFSTISLILL